MNHETCVATHAPVHSHPVPKSTTQEPLEANHLARGACFAERYEIASCLGSGAMGTVYEALDRRVGEVIALKKLTGQPSAEDVARFAREVRLARRVTHRNVARTHDFGEHEGQFFLTMELVRGESLDVVLARRRPEVSTAVTVALQVAEAVRAAHEAAIVHRDLKPANVMLAEDGRVVVTDFGIARTAAEPQLTLKREMVGTPIYMAPEQVLAEEVDERTDVFAFGVMLYEMLTGALPFTGKSAIQIAVARLHDDPVDPRHHAPVPDELSALTLRCLKRDPGERPANFEPIITALSDWCASSSMAQTASMPSPPVAIEVGDVSLAVRPFSYRGPSEADYLGEALAEELIDVLSRTRGLRVLAFGATAAEESTDPRELGRRLGVNYVVTGSVQRAGSQVRITPRLVATEDGTQVWSERVVGEVDDLFELQEKMSRRIAESLRLELDAVGHGAIPEAVLARYFRARRALMTDGFHEAELHLTELSRCIDEAPHFKGAVAFRAVAASRAWWTPTTSPDSGETAKQAVEVALVQAPDHADTHLAHAAYHQQMGEYAATVTALGRALSIAPTHPLAHCYLGGLQAEAGKVEEGRRRLEFALSLDPLLTTPHAMLSRIAHFEQDWERSEAHLKVIRERQLGGGTGYHLIRLRKSLWLRDHDALQALRESVSISSPIAPALNFLLGYIFDTIDPDDLCARFEDVFGNPNNIRFRSFLHQLVVELLSFKNDGERGLTVLRAGADLALCDLDWVDRCPRLGCVRIQEGFAEVRAQIRSTAGHILASSVR